MKSRGSRSGGIEAWARMQGRSDSKLDQSAIDQRQVAAGGGEVKFSQLLREGRPYSPTPWHSTDDSICI